MVHKDTFNMSRLLKEPLLHFFLLGALVFMAYGWLGDGGRGIAEIVVSRGQQENLIQTFERTWRRPPTAEEFNGLVEDFIRMEIAYRESIAMNLDRDDIVINCLPRTWPPPCHRPKRNWKSTSPLTPSRFGPPQFTHWNTFILARIAVVIRLKLMRFRYSKSFKRVHWIAIPKLSAIR